ncbi:MAG: MFS transporter [Dehalococcoidia bacterium]|nr:MFS transporter [Dehalococcoidia bacterium]
MHWKAPRIFYGWWIVVACFFIALYVGGAVFYGFTAIFEPVANELGWSYTQVSFAASLRGLEMGILAPFVGLLVDRWSPRKLVITGAIISALGLILLSYTSSLAMFYGAFILVAIGMSSCTMTVLMSAVANWFRRRIGTASGIAVSGFGFGGLLVPVIVRLIEVYQWRMTMTILGLGMLVILIPLSLLLRHKPEQYGYLPDGEVKEEVISGHRPGLSQNAEVHMGVKQVLKSRAFWHIALPFTYHLMIVSAIVTHVMPYLSSIGVARSMSSLVATAIPLASIAGRLLLGWLGDRFDKRKVVAGAFTMIGLGTLCFGYTSIGGLWLIVPFLILLGTGYGGNNAMRPSLVREYFGRTNFGTVFGLIMGVNLLGGLVGPVLAGWVFDNRGNYDGIWFIFAGLAVAAVISILTTPSTTTSKASAKV